MNWITRWKKIGIKVKQIFKKQPDSQEQTDWKNCPLCKKISYLPDLVANSSRTNKDANNFSTSPSPNLPLPPNALRH